MVRDALLKRSWLGWCVPGALVLGLAFAIFSRRIEHSTWLDTAGLAATLMAITAAMHGVSRGRHDGMEHILTLLLSAWTVALLGSLALGTAASGAPRLMQALSWCLLAGLLVGFQAIISQLAYAFYMAFHHEGPHPAEEHRRPRR